ncbi:hypothetical protein [Streptomyces olivaceiscleroticus]|uniref:Uncharacterized protein n=1 Tax=Streptomyces olivaceiscleroticus TaxID=68245 RepID=A0ABN1BLR4_9ACTN
MTTPAPEDPDTAAVDQTLAARNLRSAEVIAGVLDAGLLHAVGRPDKLPTVLFPDVDENVVQAIFDLGVKVGVWGGQAMLRPQWDPTVLDRFQRELEAGAYEQMGRRVRSAAQCGRRTVSEHL